MTSNSAFLGTLYASMAVNTTALDHAVVRMRQFETTTNAALTRIQKKYAALGTTMKTFGRSMTQFVTLPMALVGGAAFKMYKDFEFSMNKVVSLVGVARAQVDEWSKAVLALAPAVGKSPKELADAMYFITSAGIRGKEALEILEESAKSSAGGLGEVKVVADLLTSAMNAYGKESLSAAQANDVLVATVREGKAEAALLAQSMGLVLPIASAMGASFAQVGAATAAMTRTGTKAATAAIQLRQIFNSLLKPAKEAEQALIDMKTSSAELRRIIREDGLLSALLELKEISEEYGIEALGKVIPNIRSLTGVLDITGKNLKENIILFEAIENSLGDAGKMFEETADTVQFKFNVAIAGIQTALTKFGASISDLILPLLDRFSSFIQRVADRFDAMNPATKSLIVTLGGLLLVLGPIVTIMGFMVGNVVPGLIIVLKRLNKATVATSIGFSKLYTIILANPLVAIGVAIAAAAAYLFIYTKRLKAAAEAQDEFNKRGLEVTDEEIMRIAKMGENARQVQYEILSAAKNEEGLQKTFGKTLRLLDDIANVAERAISMPGLNKRQLETSAEEVKNTILKIQDELILLSEEDYVVQAEIDLQIKELAAEDAAALQKGIDSLYASLQPQQGQLKLVTPYVQMADEMKISLDDMSLNSEAFLDSLSTTGSKIIDLTKNNDDKLIYLKKKGNEEYRETLNERLKDMNIVGDAYDKAVNEISESDKKIANIATQNAIKATLDLQISVIDTMAKLGWKELDVLQAKTAAFDQALQALANLGFDETDSRMKDWSATMLETNKRIELLKDGTLSLTKVMSDLQKELAISAMLAASFPEFLPGSEEFKAFSSLLDTPARDLRSWMKTLDELTEKKYNLQLQIEETTGFPFDEGSLELAYTWDPKNAQDLELINQLLAVAEEKVVNLQKAVGMVSYDQLMKETGASIDLIEKMGESYGIGFKVAEKSAAAWISKLDEAHKKLLIGKMSAQDFEKFMREAMTKIQEFTFEGLGEAVAAELYIIQRQAELTGDSVKAAKDSINVLKAAAAAAYDIPVSMLSFEDLQKFIDSIGLSMEEFLEIVSSSKAWDEFLKNAQVALQSLGAFIGSLQGLFQQQMQNQITAVEEYAKKRNKSEKWVADETLKIHKEMGKKIKAMAILQAIINGALAITNILATVPAGPLNPLAWVGIGMAIAATAAQVATISAQPMAEGGIVPPGYPKDSYPALLTSGEEVLPARRQRKPTITPEEVIFRIEGTELVGILKKQMSLEENY